MKNGLPFPPAQIWIEPYREGYPVPVEFYTHPIHLGIEYRRVDPPAAPDEGDKALAQLRVRCSGCKQEIDPHVCWCGQSISHGYDNHLIIPMGCTCYRDDGENTLARRIVKKISEAALELAFVRHDLTSDEVIVDEDADIKTRVAANEEFLERLKEDTLNCLTGDDFGCLDPAELDATNCEVIWLNELLATVRAEVLENACRAICPNCVSEFSTPAEPLEDKWWHRHTGRGSHGHLFKGRIAGECRAWPIRNLMNESARKVEG